MSVDAWWFCVICFWICWVSSISIFINESNDPRSNKSNSWTRKLRDWWNQFWILPSCAFFCWVRQCFACCIIVCVSCASYWLRQHRYVVDLDSSMYFRICWLRYRRESRLYKSIARKLLLNGLLRASTSKCCFNNRHCARAQNAPPWPKYATKQPPTLSYVFVSCFLIFKKKYAPQW